MEVIWEGVCSELGKVSLNSKINVITKGLERSQLASHILESNINQTVGDFGKVQGGFQVFNSRKCTVAK